MLVFGQSGCIRAKVIVFVLKWLYLGKGGIIRQMFLCSCKSCCLGTKVVVLRKKCLYSGKVVVFGRKWLYSSRVDVVGQKWLYSAKWF